MVGWGKHEKVKGHEMVGADCRHKFVNFKKKNSPFIILFYFFFSEHVGWLAVPLLEISHHESLRKDPKL